MLKLCNKHFKAIIIFKKNNNYSLNNNERIQNPEEQFKVLRENNHSLELHIHGSINKVGQKHHLKDIIIITND